jgi:hypothetical protein
MDPNKFTGLLIDGIIRGLQADAAIAWNVLLTHPWMIVAGAGLLTLSLIARLTRRFPRARRRYR